MSYTYVRKYVHASIHACVRSYITYVYTHAYIHTFYMYIYIHIYRYAIYIYTYMRLYAKPGCTFMYSTSMNSNELPYYGSRAEAEPRGSWVSDADLRPHSSEVEKTIALLLAIWQKSWWS